MAQYDNPQQQQYQENLCNEKYAQVQQKCCGEQTAPRTSEEVIDYIFTYHSPTLTTLPKFQAIREAGKYFAKVIAQNVPAGQDRLAAILKVREAVLLANAGISLDGKQL